MTDDERHAQQHYDDLMKQVFGPALRAAGFRGSAGRFERGSEKYWVQLGFQKSVYNDPDEVEFTINVAVTEREPWAAKAASSPGFPSKPSPNTAFPLTTSARIGKLLPEGRDVWWVLRSNDDVTAVAEEVLASISYYAIPWLDEKSRLPNGS